MAFDWKDILEMARCGAFALIGSVARTLADNLGKDKTKTALVALMVANGAVSGFCGMMVFPLSKIMHLDPYWTMFISGMAGWMGGNFLTILEQRVVSKLGGKADVSPDNPS
jgi:DMSO reductase anchor subunit